MKKTKMKNVTKSSQIAGERARLGNEAGRKAREARDERNHIRIELNEWKQIFIDSPVLLLTLLCLFSIKMEVFFSWPMYNDLMSQMTGSANTGLSLVGALFIVLLGAYVSHLISKAVSPSIFDFSVYNDLDYSDNHIPKAAAEERVRIKARRQFIRGILLGIVLLVFVAAISWQRVWLMTSITGEDYSLTHKVLPIFCVAIEIISGIYLMYTIRRIAKKVRLLYLDWIYNTQKKLCGYETAMAHNFLTHALEASENFAYSRDIHESEFRYHYRSINNEDYVDEIPPIKTLTIKVCENDIPLQGIHLAGTLSNGEYCNSIVTNTKGIGILTWQSDAKEVVAVYTNSILHKGPFNAYTNILINLQPPKAVGQLN